MDGHLPPNSDAINAVQNEQAAVIHQGVANQPGVPNHPAPVNQQLLDGEPPAPGNGAGPSQNGLIQPNCYGSATILSLDGGGIRGYSSLLILERLMESCAYEELQENRKLRDRRELDLQPTSSAPDPLESRLPLPCHYFDYVVGTSTGGLIAILLGRLRMNVRDCKLEYKQFGKEIFSHKRYHRWTRYSSNKLSSVLKRVVQTRCLDASSVSDGHDWMYQADPVCNPCRTIVYAARVLQGKNERTHAFRSYHPYGSSEESHEILDNRNPTQVYIYQAALATTAAPTFFKVANVNGEEFLDGGITANNPTSEAWNEAHQRRLRGNHPHSIDQNAPSVGHIVSIGTGLKENKGILVRGTPLSKLRRVIRRAIRHMTDTEPTHEAVTTQAANQNPHPLDYYRFNVITGLERIKLDHCKRNNRTFNKMDTATREYLQRADTIQRISLCARLLVERRRARCTDEELRRNFNLTRPGPRENVYNDLYPTAS